MGSAEAGQMLFFVLMLALQGRIGCAAGAYNNSQHHQSWTSGVQVPTTTNITLNGTVATAHVISDGGFWEEAVNIIPNILGMCPTGTVCWRAFMYGGSCLANSTIQLSTSSQKGSVGQASFDYASTLYTDSDIFYGVIADYQGSHLCKLAPSEGVLQVS
ncbi:hypothetical protein CVIRNUC_011050 [Coccomyxa viridis]|uniref:Uncharacterized protein n=1 Tax=Coccomyxa viridis TaxID=1274662 RepID=A0AAV1IP25_9CHLO|nr:hypothetical protein CVIRNUC_011050 [Coccomyxa viridis]